MQFRNFFVPTYFANFDFEKKIDILEHSTYRFEARELCLFLFESAYPLYERQYQTFQFRLSFFVMFEHYEETKKKNIFFGKGWPKIMHKKSSRPELKILVLGL